MIHADDEQAARTGKAGKHEERSRLTCSGPRSTGLNTDTAQALASLDALRGIDADLLLPGHGDPWTQGVAEAVRKAKAAGPS